MDRSIAVLLVSFVGLAVSAAAALATQGRPVVRLGPMLPVATGRGLALALLAVAGLGLSVATAALRQDSEEVEAQAGIVAADVVALDTALRTLGPAAEPTRMMLFRYAEGIARTLYPRAGAAPRMAPEGLEALRQDLARSVATLAPAAAANPELHTRLEALMRSKAGLMAITPKQGLTWPRPVLLGWLVVGVGLLALLSPAPMRSLVLLAGLAALLSAGVFLLEEMASPIRSMSPSPLAILDSALFAIEE